MDAASRRQAILDRLRAADRPVSASALASERNVSRQIIVGDIAILRAGGAEISATPRGYVLPQATDGITRTIACRHTLAQTGQELDILVDNGCTVLDVIVEHPGLRPAHRPAADQQPLRCAAVPRTRAGARRRPAEHAHPAASICTRCAARTRPRMTAPAPH